MLARDNTFCHKILAPKNVQEYTFDMELPEKGTFESNLTGGKGRPAYQFVSSELGADKGRAAFLHFSE